MQPYLNRLNRRGRAGQYNTRIMTKTKLRQKRKLLQLLKVKIKMSHSIFG
jgi:hypothetical protein